VRSISPSSTSLRCIRLHIEYDGTDFVGWQIQRNGRSAQGEISRVLEQILQEPVTLTGAGRTDSGVHARGQVAAFKTANGIDCQSLFKGLNGLLPEDIRIRSVAEAPLKFNPRYDAHERRYSYTIARVPTAIDRRYCWFVPYSLDVRLMETAATLLIGEHDFRSFCSHESEVANTVCDVRISRWEISDKRLLYDVRADRFVHGMVRAFVGTMVDIGRGYMPLADLPAILSSRDRSKAGAAAPPQGLVLEEVIYPTS
jgi:tRNA pseudouridine38-40 synthase